MSQNQTEPTDPEPDDLPEQDTDQGPVDDGTEGAPQDRRDDRRRTRLREAEAQVQTLTARVEVMTRREVLRMLGQHTPDPEALLTLSSTDLADLLDEDGQVDADRVAALADEVIGQRPYLRRPAHHADLAAQKPVQHRPTPRWGEVFR